jgi:hypothetical protein
MEVGDSDTIHVNNGSEKNSNQTQAPSPRSKIPVYVLNKSLLY